jgi:hypothetical protein
MAQSQTANTGQILSGTMNGRQNFWMGFEVQTGPGASGTLVSGFITTVNNTRTTGVTTFTVPAGKRLRILHWDVEIANNTTLAANSREWLIYCLKADQTGAALITSSPTLSTAMVQQANSTATAQTANTTITNSNKSFTEGVIDLPAGSTFGVWCNNTATSIMQIMSINGYLYNA